MLTAKKTAVLLLNLGGPERQEEVEPFLRNLFSDRQIIRLGPALLQRPIARFIARRRAPASRASYARIGGGSPIRRITTEQAAALERRLAGEGDFMVRPCMRYWHPDADETITTIRDLEAKRVIALPLYPHYSVATTGSSLSDLRRAVRRHAPALELLEIRSWPEQADYIRCLAARVREGLARFGEEQVQVVYSAHSLPKKFMDEGDPYVDELQATIRALERQTGVPGILCYQSRSGPVEWLAPSTPDTLQDLARQGCRNILVVPISFVSDHVETLYEIDILYREMAAELGMRLESTRALNSDPLFISCLRHLVRAALEQGTV